MNKVIKRNGQEVEFNTEKIVRVIKKANSAAGCPLDISRITFVANKVMGRSSAYRRSISVEEIQDIVEDELMFVNHEVARKYITYRFDHKLNREESTLLKKVKTIVEYENEEVKQENSNKDPETLPTQRDYIAGEVSKQITMNELLPEEIIEAHNEGIIHFHDADYFIQHMHNCCLVNLDDMLQNGTVITGTYIDSPKTFSTACNISTQIIAQVSSHQYGGQSISLAHLVPFIDKTRQKIRADKEYLKNYISEEEFNHMVEKEVKQDVERGIQMIQYQVITLMTTNGQAPFVTLYMNMNEVSEEMKDDMAMAIEEILKQRIRGVKNEKGVWITPAFPKLIYALDEDNIKEGSKYYYLSKLAAKCTAKRMVPDYISNKKEQEMKGAEYPCMGCRSFLTPDRTTENYAKAKNWVKGKKYYGRFNQGVVTINLVDVALSSGRDMGKFWDILSDRLENLCFPALMARHKRLLGTKSDVAPILWQHGALARLEKGETIDKLLFHGYSTISLGYAGLYECVKYMTGESHTHGGKDFGLLVMNMLNDTCERWKKETDIDFSLYGTPIESTTYKFAKCLQKRFGIVEGITDRNYITNSYHVPVFEEIDAFTKLAFESEFQALSPGGAISYIEVPNMSKNLNAIESIMKFMYYNILYSEINTKSDYCQVCGWDGEIDIVEDGTKLVWECPNCKNRDKNKMNIARRTCGYIGLNDFNQGRTQEIKERVLHIH